MNLGVDVGKQNDLYKHWLEESDDEAKTTVDELLENEPGYEDEVFVTGRVNEMKIFGADDTICYFTLESDTTGKKIAVEGVFSESDYLKYQAPFTNPGDFVTVTGTYFRSANGISLSGFYNHDHVERMEGD